MKLLLNEGNLRNRALHPELWEGQGGGRLAVAGPLALENPYIPPRRQGLAHRPPRDRLLLVSAWGPNSFISPCDFEQAIILSATPSMR